MLFDGATLVSKTRRKRALRRVVDQARQGDEEAFGALVRAVAERIRADTSLNGGRP